MKASAVLFWVITGFFFLSAIVYTVWGLLYYGQVEWVGTVALTLTGILGAFIGFYLTRSHAAQGGELPEDRQDGNIDDGDPELGHFSPWSWWPFMLGVAVGLMALGLAVGFWICFIAVAFGLVCLVGWVFEYYRGYFAR
jgi:cytochrome c oxidase subunit IV